MNDRQTKILDLLKNQEFMTISQLSKVLHYSPSTIRRDLNGMENSNFVRRIHGGALLLRPDQREMPTDVKANLNYKAKNYIASLASDYIEEHQVIFLDGSSTSNILAQYLINFHHLLIVTTNMSTAIFLSKKSDNKVIALGGLMGDVIAASDITIENLSRYIYDIAFMSCRGIDLKYGITDRLETESTVKNQLFQYSKSTILLVDNSKFDKTFSFKDCDLNQLSSIVTNEIPTKYYINLFKEKEIELVY